MFEMEEFVRMYEDYCYNCDVHNIAESARMSFEDFVELMQL